MLSICKFHREGLNRKKRMIILYVPRPTGVSGKGVRENAAGKGSEEVDHEDHRLGISYILQPVFSTPVKEQRVSFIQDEGLLFYLVFHPAFQNIFTFIGIGLDHLFPGR